jgi:multiple sugar transport system ATP-binding protein
MYKIELREITKNFGNVEVLKGINLQVQNGEFISLVGPSGCGKSTLLRIIAGLEDQDSGDVLIQGKMVNKVKPSDRDLAMVFQSYALYPHLTVAENLTVPLKLRDLGRMERMPFIGRFFPGRKSKLQNIHEAVAETAKLLKIQPLLNRKPGQLSGGQRQRVAVGRAMVRDPVAFLMDEPLSNLDAALRVHMRAEISQLHKTLGATTIYVTHDQAEALTMSTRVALMMAGEILQFDEPDKLYTDPRDLRVAEFIGSPKINTLSGRIGSGGRVEVCGAVLRRQSVGDPQECTVGLRPEHLIASKEKFDDALFTAVVLHKENLGSDFFIHAELEGAPNQKLIVRTPPEVGHDIQNGDKIYLDTKPNQAMVFGSNSHRIYFRYEVGSQA